MRWTAVVLLLLPLLLAAACEREPAPPTKVTLNEAVPGLAEPPPRAADQDRPGRDNVVNERMMIPEIAGLPTAAGEWRAARGGTRFAGANGPLFEIACDAKDRSIVIRRFGATGDIQILADRGANLFTAQSKDGEAVARFPANYPWFADVLAKAGGRIGIRTGGGAPIVLPANPSIAAVIEDCG